MLSQTARHLSSDGDEKLNAVSVFKDEFADCFKDFVMEVNVLAGGRVAYQDSFLTDMGALGVAGLTALIDGTIAILAAVGLMGAMTAVAISIPLAIIGLISSYAYHKYHEIKKQKQYEHADKVLERKMLSTEIVEIADLLANMHLVQLEAGTTSDATKLAKSCFKAISVEILTNNKFDFNELLQSASLQGVILRASKSRKFGLQFFDKSQNIKSDGVAVTTELAVSLT